MPLVNLIGLVVFLTFGSKVIYLLRRCAAVREQQLFIPAHSNNLNIIFIAAINSQCNKSKFFGSEETELLTQVLLLDGLPDMAKYCQ